MFLPVGEQLERILEGAAEVIPEAELAAKLGRARERDEPLIVKQGFDPTRPDLHLGHAVSLHKLRTFQELGHTVVFVIGDFTARIGDPSGRDETRPQLSEEEIEENLISYREQVFEILDPRRTVLRRNSEWLEPLRLADILELTSRYTVARMLEREDFAVRYAEGRPISLVEFLYPMMQGYDSVELRADVELGGTDQKFNLLLARTLQERSGQEPQVCLLMPLLRGTDGARKMSNSYDNYIGLAMEPSEMFGRAMSIPDSLLEEWLTLVSSARGTELEERLAQARRDPLEAKRWLALDLVRRYRGEEAAQRARAAFDRVHRDRRPPETVPARTVELPSGADSIWLPYALRDTGLAASTSEAIRLIGQRAVRVDGEIVEDRDRDLAPGEYLIQKGKRVFIRLRVAGRS
ncbi:MAG: tyrosine--tRNA ligase [Gemmatimonadota bacterium]